MIDLSLFEGIYDPDVHPLPSEAKAKVGDKIDSPYVGKATILTVSVDPFYGAPPISQGVPYYGAWDGLAYEVKSERGLRTTLDRSRLGRVIH